MPAPTHKSLHGSQQVNGFYVHSSPPKVLQVHSSVIRQWLRAGDLGRLEQLVLDGQGHKLVGEYSADPKVRAFLKKIPAFLVKSKKLHDAVVKGDPKLVQKLFNSIKSRESPLKSVHLSKSQGGLGLLHKAVYYGHPHVVEFLVSNFPESIKMRDNDGKIPLHYCGASKEAGKIWPLLIKAGADANAVDSKGKRPAYYMERSNEIQLPEEKILSGMSVGSAPDKGNNLVIKPSNIRIWIHDSDLKKLRRVVWEGHGAKLRNETSKHPKVKRFLDGVPYVLNIIKDVHSSVINNNLEEFLKKTSDPVPAEILGSKDANGLSPLHKAAGLNRWKIANNILKRNPNLVFGADLEGKSPLHYAAVLKDDGAMYNLLKENGADETVLDSNGKTASYYKSNPKEMNPKILESVPEAPRISVTLPQNFDWSLFCSEDTPRISNHFLNGNSPARMSEMQNEETAAREDEPNEPASEGEADKSEDLESKELPTENKSSPSELENGDRESVEDIKETEESKNVDIWTNDDEGGGEEEEEEEEEDGPLEYDTNQVEDEGETQEKADSDDRENVKEEGDAEEEEEEEENTDAPEEICNEETPDDPPEETREQVSDEAEEREKTEWEIAEERQRLLDEGLLKLNSEEEDAPDEEKNVNDMIEAGDMEKLASLVLNGEGHKLLEKKSSNSEIQSFLDNVPVYMAKIRAVHQTARNGSLKELQSALDRRKFAVARESDDKLGATPLHMAVIFGNAPIIKYLGGRFPETLTSKDNFGRTPLHYAAATEDSDIYDTLLNLGANPTEKDDEGHDPTFYLDNPGELTREKLLEETSASARATNEGSNNQVTDPTVRNAEPETSFDEGIPLSKNSDNEDADRDDNDGDDSQSRFNLTDRDEYGQSVLHFAAARAHGRGGLFQLIHESGINLGYRDELYRTARDIAQQANIFENVNEIDKYVISLAAKGETGKLVELYLEGYDHILDLEDDEDNDILSIVSNKNNEKTLAFLKAIPALEEKRETIHRAIRSGDWKTVEDLVSASKNGRFLIIGKNASGRCSLHVAVLCQQTAAAEFIAQAFPETLKIGDNLERTSLHYAMGVEEVETLSKILIKCGAKRVVKDLKGRQPTYYFMNKTEILKLQQEENALGV